MADIKRGVLPIKPLLIKNTGRNISVSTATISAERTVSKNSTATIDTDFYSGVRPKFANASITGLTNTPRVLTPTHASKLAPIDTDFYKGVREVTTSTVLVNPLPGVNEEGEEITTQGNKRRQTIDIPADTNNDGKIDGRGNGRYSARGNPKNTAPKIDDTPRDPIRDPEERSFIEKSLDTVADISPARDIPKNTSTEITSKPIEKPKRPIDSLEWEHGVMGINRYKLESYLDNYHEQVNKTFNTVDKFQPGLWRNLVVIHRLANKGKKHKEKKPGDHDIGMWSMPLTDISFRGDIDSLLSTGKAIFNLTKSNTDSLKDDYTRKEKEANSKGVRVSRSRPGIYELHYSVNNNITIINKDTTERIQLMTVPKEVKYTPATNWVAVASMGRNVPFYIYTGAEDTIEMEISWYAKDNYKTNVIDNCRKLESWSKGNGYSVPPSVWLLFGKPESGDILFKNSDYDTFIISSASYTLSNFSPDMTKMNNFSLSGMFPLNAKQTLVFKRVCSNNPNYQQIQGK